MSPSEPNLRLRIALLLGIQYRRICPDGQVAGAKVALHTPPVLPEHRSGIRRTSMPLSTASSSSSPMCTNCWGRSSAAANPRRSSAVSRVCRRLCIAGERHWSAGNVPSRQRAKSHLPCWSSGGLCYVGLLASVRNPNPRTEVATAAMQGPGCFWMPGSIPEHGTVPAVKQLGMELEVIASFLLTQNIYESAQHKYQHFLLPVHV